MTRYPRRAQALAVAVAALAGFIDAIGFLAAGGFFVSFMSGNATRLGVGLVRGGGEALVAGGLIASFLGGVVAGSLAVRRAGGRREAALLGLVALVLAGAAALDGAAQLRAATLLAACAMGMVNTLFEEGGEVTVGLTYMTGGLVKLGQRLAAALTGGSRTAWIPLLLLWLGFVAGVATGAAAYPFCGLSGLWGAATAAAVLALVAARLRLSTLRGGVDGGRVTREPGSSMDLGRGR